MKQLIFAVLFALTSQAYAGVFFKDDWEKDDCPKRHSLAWCVVKASTGSPKEMYLIEDAKVNPEAFKALESFGQKSVQEATVVTTAAVASYMSIYKMTAGAAASSVLSDRGFGFMLGMDILSSLFFNGSEMRNIAVFAWLPSTQPFPDAQVEFAKTYMSAVTDVMGFTKSDIVQLGTLKGAFGSEAPLEELVVEGGPCTASARCVLNEPFNMLGFRRALSGGNATDLEHPPAFISSSPSALSQRFGSALPTGYITSSTDCKMNGFTRDCQNRKYYRFPIDKLVQISAKLPSTAFIFVGIDPSVKDSIPTVLNQGKVLFFVTETTDKAITDK
jgi:hypothetical protein